MTELLSTFKQYLTLDCGLSELSITAYVHDVEWFLDTTKQCCSHKERCRMINDELYQREFSRSTISRKKSSIRHYYHFLSQQYPDQSFPLEWGEMPKKEKRLPKVLSKNEAIKLCNFVAAHSDFSSMEECGRVVIFVWITSL